MKKCTICGSEKFCTTNTYKHRWITCSDCGNVFRERKEKYLFEGFPLLKSRLIPVQISNALDRMVEVTVDNSNYYNYYDNVAAKGSESGTKWAGEYEALLATLKGLDISLKGKRVLDVSGGPGFVVKHLDGFAERAVVTEYSEDAVKGMIHALKIEAVKYDFNSDKIRDVVEGQFDVVLVRYAINFCNDIAAFAHSLKDVIAPGGLVFVSFVLPSLGTCLRWHHDEYTYNVLYNPETLAKGFCSASYEVAALTSDGEYHYTRGRSAKVNLFAWPYKIAALLSKNSINYELVQKNRILVFRAPSA
jgi:2-polyprenyl-3-methyl-5-hydroxy-6-metoxy-1,4-benzoquinol methylase